MNSLFGINTSLSSLAKDFTGFAHEVVEELQTVLQQPENDDEDCDSQFDEEELAIEEELKHQLLQLSDDEDGGSTIRTLNEEKDDTQQNTINENESNDKKTENESKDQTIENEDDKTIENEAEIPMISSKEYDDLQQKYTQLKQNYRKSMLLVEKYQIHNKSLKETLNEQMVITEKQQSQIDEYQVINDELNNKIIELQNDDNKLSIFEDEMVVKSVSLNTNNDNNEDETEKLKKKLQKASTYMKEMKKRYKKIKDDLCLKIEEFDQLKSQYVQFKKTSSDKVQELKNKLKEISSKQTVIYDVDGLNKALQTILNSKFVEEIKDVEMIDPIHLEMIALLNRCIETISLFIQSTAINDIDETKSDSVLIMDKWSVEDLESVKMNTVTLREIVCEFIAVIQQWLKVLNDGIDDKQDMSNDKSKSITEEFQSID